MKRRLPKSIHTALAVLQPYARRDDGTMKLLYRLRVRLEERHDVPQQTLFDPEHPTHPLPIHGLSRGPL